MVEIITYINSITINTASKEYEVIKNYITYTITCN